MQDDVTTSDQRTGSEHVGSRNPGGKRGGRLLVVLVMAALGIVYMAWRASAKSDVEEKLAAIREAGHPARAAEAAEFYRLPDGVTDTSQLWLEAAEPLQSSAFDFLSEELPIVGWGGDDIPPPGQPWRSAPLPTHRRF